MTVYSSSHGVHQVCTRCDALQSHRADRILDLAKSNWTFLQEFTVIRYKFYLGAQIDDNIVVTLYPALSPNTGPTAVILGMQSGEVLSTACMFDLRALESVGGKSDDQGQS